MGFVHRVQCRDDYLRRLELNQMVQFDAHGVWAIVLVEDSQYPELVAARKRKTQAIEEIERLRLAFRERTKQSKGVSPR